MLYSPRTNLKPKIIHVSHSVFSVTSYKSASLIRSRTTGDTCIHFANKSTPPPPTHLSDLMSSQLYSSVDFGRKWQLIHEHVTPNRFYWWVIPASPISFTCCFSSKNLACSGARKSLFVFCTTEQAILMARNEVRQRPVMLLEFSTFSTAWCSQSEINLLCRDTFCIECLTACHIHHSQHLCSCTGT